MRIRTVILILAIVALTGLVEYRVRCGPVQIGRPGEVSERISVAGFEALDMDNHMFRLERYLGRHDIFIVFFSADTGPLNDPFLKLLIEHSNQLDQQQIKVVGVSSMLPQQNRQTLLEADVELPSHITLVSDPLPEYLLHQRWQCFDPNTASPISAAFHIDRAGRVVGHANRPVPLTDPLAALRLFAR